MIGIYEFADPSTEFSVSGNFTNPASVTLDGFRGESVETKMYVRNDDSNYWYSDITVQPVDFGENIIDGTGTTQGYFWKLYAGDSQPSEEQWELTAAGNQISLSDIGESGTGDSSTYLPFWLKIEVPRGAPVDSFTSTILRLGFTENSV